MNREHIDEKILQPHDQEVINENIDSSLLNNFEIPFKKCSMAANFKEILYPDPDVPIKGSGSKLYHGAIK